MQITIEKCEECGCLFEDPEQYAKHTKVHQTITAINGAFAPVEDKDCRFANGHWNVQRDREWLDRYKDAIAEAANIKDVQPYSYGWYRCLGDSGSMYYGLAFRIMCVCSVCFREWGQPYYANNCEHKDVVLNLKRQ